LARLVAADAGLLEYDGAGIPMRYSRRGCRRRITWRKSILGGFTMSKTILSGLVLMLALAIVPNSASADTADRIEQLEQQRSQAILAGDMATLDALYANEFYYNRAGGDSLSKAEYFSFLTSGDIKVRRSVREDVTIRVYGDTAVVTGVQHNDINLK